MPRHTHDDDESAESEEEVDDAGWKTVKEMKRGQEARLGFIDEINKVIHMLGQVLR